MKIYYFIILNNHLLTNSAECIAGELSHWNTLEIRINSTHIKINFGLWRK